MYGEANRAGTSMVGSGGWANIIEKYTRAKAYCARPFEVQFEGRRKVQVTIPEEWIGEARPDLPGSARRRVELSCCSATEADVAPNSLDAVLTDPPYFSNVQYAELMDFCYVWLRRLLGPTEPAFRAASTRTPGELTGNETLERGLEHFTGGLSEVFRRMARALKPGSPLAFTYHNNELDAYVPVAVAILDAGLTCTAALPCPGEMAASVHINGTGSSVVDTVFVCRAPDFAHRNQRPSTARGLAEYVSADCDALRLGGVEVTAGDVRCLRFGHLVRMAVDNLRATWEPELLVRERLERVRGWLKASSAADVCGQLFENLPQQRKPGTKRKRGVARGDSNASLPF
jgi:hypothetical protein